MSLDAAESRRCLPPDDRTAVGEMSVGNRHVNLLRNPAPPPVGGAYTATIQPGPHQRNPHPPFQRGLTPLNTPFEHPPFQRGLTPLKSRRLRSCRKTFRENGAPPARNHPAA